MLAGRRRRALGDAALRGLERDEVHPIAAALGPPVFGVPGEEPRYSGAASLGSDATELRLKFGPGGLLEVGTSVEPVDARRTLLRLSMQIGEVTFPLTIEVRPTIVDVDGLRVGFEILTVGTEVWLGTAQVLDRWVTLCGRGISPDGIAICNIELKDWP